jgi:hypothetical protein
VVKSRFSEQVAVLLARASGRAIRRRQAVVEDRAGLPLTLVQHWLWTHESMKLLLISRFASILFFT